MRKKTVFIFAALFFLNGTAMAQDGYVAYTPGEGVEVKALDLKFEPSTYFDFQGCPKPNKRSGGDFGVSWVAYYDAHKKFGDWAIAWAQIRQGWGDTVEKDLGLFCNVNYNASDYGGNVKIKKFGYKHYFCDRQLALSCGKMKTRNVFCQNKYANNDDTQFINTLFNEFPGIDWPVDFTFTMRAEMHLEAIDFLEFEFNYFEGDADWEKIFTHGVFTWQLNLKPASFFDLNPEEWEGNYRFYTWLNTRKHAGLVKKWDPPAIDTKLPNYGFGISFDQMATDVFGLFCRVGCQQPDVIPADGGVTVLVAWAGGVQMTGRYWDRDKDVLSFGIGQIAPSKEYIDAGNPGKPEGHIETYYRCQVNKCLQISPDFQLIWNPDGVGGETPVFTYGFRVGIVF